MSRRHAYHIFSHATATNAPGHSRSWNDALWPDAVFVLDLQDVDAFSYPLPSCAGAVLLGKAGGAPRPLSRLSDVSSQVI